jgi:hypothetical protein
MSPSISNIGTTNKIVMIAMMRFFISNLPTGKTLFVQSIKHNHRKKEMITSRNRATEQTMRRKRRHYLGLKLFNEEIIKP